MSKWNGIGAAFAALMLVALPATAGAEALSTQGPKITLAHGRLDGVGRISAAPVPLAPNVFIVPFTGRVNDGGLEQRAAQFQRIGPNFSKQGAPGTWHTGSTASCCANFAENGGARLSSGKTQIASPIFTFDTQYEIFGYYTLADGTPLEFPDRLTRSKGGHQNGPVIVPMKGGTAFAMWGDYFHEADESEVSVRGAMLSGEGKPVGADILIESRNTGYQIPSDGVQLANGKLLLVWKNLRPPSSGPRASFFGQIMRSDGRLQGKPFLLAETQSNFFQAEMRVAALPNGNFVAAWVDAPFRREALPYYQLFSETGAPLGEPQLLGRNRRETGVRIDVAALADSRFVVTGTLLGAGESHFVAQLVSPEGQKIGRPLVLETFADFNGTLEHHSANVGYLSGQPPEPHGLETATDPRLIYVVWRSDAGANSDRFTLYGQALRASP